MTNRQETISVMTAMVRKVDLAKMQRLSVLVPELTRLDELVGHNATTAVDQLKHKADALMVSLPTKDRDAILSLLPRVDEESLIVAARMLEYNLPEQVVLFVHLDDLIILEHDIPQINADVSQALRVFLSSNPKMHLVLLSHDSADVTALLSASLVGQQLIDRGQVSMVYESGLGLYLGGADKLKKDYLKDIRVELSHVIHRMSLAAANKFGESGFSDKFYFTATEYSVGIRVHPFARGKDDGLDKEAARELVKALAVALADLIKEDVSACEQHIYNYFLSVDPNLATIFDKQPDERLWDKEKTDQYLGSLQFVHLGARGSIIRPAEVTDVPAAKEIVQSIGRDCLIATCGDRDMLLPLLQWTITQEHGMVGCSEGAEPAVKQLVESRGGIEYRPGQITELFKVLDAYQTLRLL